MVFVFVRGYPLLYLLITLLDRILFVSHRVVEEKRAKTLMKTSWGSRRLSTTSIDNGSRNESSDHLDTSYYNYIHSSFGSKRQYNTSKYGKSSWCGLALYYFSYNCRLIINWRKFVSAVLAFIFRFFVLYFLSRSIERSLEFLRLKYFCFSVDRS